MGAGASAAITEAAEEDLKTFMSTLAIIQREKLQAVLYDLGEIKPTVKPGVEQQAADDTALQQDSANEQTAVQQTDVIVVSKKSGADLDAQNAFPKNVLVSGAESIQPSLMGLYVKSSIAPSKEHSHRPIYQSPISGYYLHYNLTDGYDGIWIISDTCTGREGKICANIPGAPCPTAVSEWLVLTGGKWSTQCTVKVVEASDEKMVTLRVYAFSGLLCSVTAERSWNIGEVMAAIEKATHIPAEGQLLYVGQESFASQMMRSKFANDSAVDLTLVRREIKQRAPSNVSSCLEDDSYSCFSD